MLSPKSHKRESIRFRVQIHQYIHYWWHYVEARLEKHCTVHGLVVCGSESCTNCYSNAASKTTVAETLNNGSWQCSCERSLHIMH
jgi:hypothetical protein